MRTTLDLPDSLFRTLKARAAMDGKTLKDLVIDFVQQGLTKTASEAPPMRTLFPAVLPATGQTSPRDSSLLTNAGIYALLNSEDDAAAFGTRSQKPDNAGTNASP